MTLVKDYIFGSNYQKLGHALIPKLVSTDPLGFWTISHGRAWGPPYHSFVVIAPMIMKFGTGIKLDVSYTMVTKTVYDPVMTS